MKPTLALTLAGLMLAGFEATAQNRDTNRWDISRIDVSKLPPPSDETGLTFDKDIKPMLKVSCVRCHGAERPREGLRLDTLEGVLKGGRDGKMVVPGDSAKSLLVVAAARIDARTTMPPKPRRRPGQPPPGQPGEAPPSQGGGPAGPPPAKPMSAEQVGVLRAWIDQGAK
jgi:Planctomycete cytochrome C